MCGIFAVVGDGSGQQNAGQKVFEGLKRLEYRGYDSWGVAVVTPTSLAVEKHVGKISGVNGITLPESSIAIGHTRWATHGGVTQVNAHPHLATDGSFALAQNGVVENYLELKEQLVDEGYQFITQTDTEVIVRLIEKCRQSNPAFSLKENILQAFNQLKGRNTIIVLEQGKVYAARNGSPLLVGRKTDTQEYFCSSDVLSLAIEADEYLVVENGQMIEIEPRKCQLFDCQTGEELKFVFQPLQMQQSDATKGEFPHFMIKEISDSPAVIRQVIAQERAQLEHLAQIIKSAHQVYCIGSGTAGIAAAQIAYFLRNLAKIPAVSLVGADAGEFIEMLSPDDVLIAPSQSGETADVLEVLELAKQKGVKVVTYVNMPASSMSRLADLSFLANAGPEICVMSTKVFTSQVCWGYLVAKTVAGQYDSALEELEQLAAHIDQYLKDELTHQNLKELAGWVSEQTDLFLLAKTANFQIIREGMVKLIEGAYIHAHAIPAGDLKHYAITLIEKGTPVIVLTSNDQTRSDVLTAAQEVQARGATVVHIGPQLQLSQFPYQVTVPDLGELTAVMNLIPLQLLAYEVTVKLGHDVDHPRNIAKSVTVK